MKENILKVHLKLLKKEMMKKKNYIVLKKNWKNTKKCQKKKEGMK